MQRILLLIATIMLVLFASSAFAQTKVIIDSDLRVPPQDDSMAVLLALNSPELEVLGITIVPGNERRSQQVADGLKMLELSGNSDVPLFVGYTFPLIHDPNLYAGLEWTSPTVALWEGQYPFRVGGWPRSEPAEALYGDFADIEPQDQGAVDFIVNTIMDNPGEVVVIAIGPLTNVAAAILQEPAIVDNVANVIIMGGAIGSLEDGAGNVSPGAEFNFWVDPEAADIVLNSGMPINLSPLNVSRKTALTVEHYEQMVAQEGPVADLIRERMGPRYEEDPERVGLMYDQVAVATAIDPTLVSTREMYVDVDTNWGPGYGTSYGADSPWPGTSNAKPILVQYDIDWPRFIELFLERVPGTIAE